MRGEVIKGVVEGGGGGIAEREEGGEERVRGRCLKKRKGQNFQARGERPGAGGGGGFVERI